MKKLYLFVLLAVSLDSYSQVDSIYFHDHHFESQYGASGAFPSTDYMQMVTRFTPAVYPAQLTGLRVWFRNAASPAPFKAVVRQDAASTNDPNNSGVVFMSPQPIANPASNGVLDSAYSEYIDLISSNLVFNSGDVYAGVIQHLQANGFVGYALDTNNQTVNDRHWISTNQGITGSWMQFYNWSFIHAGYAITAYFDYLQNDLPEITAEKKKILYPQPVERSFRLGGFGPGNYCVSIYDGAGQLQLVFPDVNLSASFDVHSLQAGMYLVGLRGPASVTYSKFIKQ